MRTIFSSSQEAQINLDPRVKVDLSLDLERNDSVSTHIGECRLGSDETSLALLPKSYAGEAHLKAEKRSRLKRLGEEWHYFAWYMYLLRARRGSGGRSSSDTLNDLELMRTRYRIAEVLQMLCM